MLSAWIWESGILKICLSQNMPRHFTVASRSFVVIVTQCDGLNGKCLLWTRVGILVSQVVVASGGGYEDFRRWKFAE